MYEFEQYFYFFIFFFLNKQFIQFMHNKFI
jgi:hypothetical protein